MGPSARREYMARMRTMYRALRGRGVRKEKSRILKQVSETLRRCHRTAKRLMRDGPQPGDKRHREPIYSERLIRVLEAVWEAAQYAWSVRLKALLPLWMPKVKERWALTPAEQRQLLKMSPATMDRRLAPYKKKLGSKIYGQTKPGRWLRQTIPIQTDSSKVEEPGWIEADTVSHSGPNAAGLFAYTLNETDLFSGWDEPCAILGKHAEKVVAASDEIRQAFPFEEKGKDTDNGEEFINYEMDRYCRRMGIKRFRSRPYKKDDQAHIEQKNGTHVRRLIGWDRYDTQEAVDAMNDLYRNEWRLLTNLFLPSIKLDYKVREGSKLKRVYKDAETPLDRLLKSEHGDRAKLEQLRQVRERLDPFELAKMVDRKLQAIWKLASRGRIKPAAPPHVVKANRPWEHWMAVEDAKLAQLPLKPDGELVRISRNYGRDAFFGTR
ncbi:MAG: transposase family protein [Elusimicrobia bacterium]|nr:transposase family protein [Elusimicrobiota bacterium]